MKLYSTHDKTHRVSWRQAVLSGLAPDGGLYMPMQIPVFSTSSVHELQQLSFPDLSARLASAFMEDEITLDTLKTLTASSLDIPLPLKQLNSNTFVFELFHGPTCAFKDFGARFMSRLFRYFIGENAEPLTVLTATSGDTGSAVGNAFLDSASNPPIRVAILYPRGKVSTIQRKQMTTLGHNVVAYEIDGTFDDCQALVKRALADQQLQKRIRLTSANSINIARLLPQIFYYAYASLSRINAEKPPVFIVPSGNLGNVVGSLFAKAMGFPVAHSVAACNSNRTLVDFIQNNIFSPQPSIETISNAMDVGNPSNIHRLKALSQSLEETDGNPLSAVSISDENTRSALREVFENYHYVADPHTAVAASALSHSTSNRLPADADRIIVSTAHPAKFSSTVEEVLGFAPELPQQLAHIMDAEEHIYPLHNSYEALCSELTTSNPNI